MWPARWTGHITGFSAQSFRSLRAREAQFVLLDRAGGEISLQANADASLLILSGEPINERSSCRAPSS